MVIPAYCFVCCDSVWSVLGMPHRSAVRSLLSLVRYNTRLDQLSFRRNPGGVPISSVVSDIATLVFCGGALYCAV